MSDYAWTRWLAVAVLMEPLSRAADTYLDEYEGTCGEDAARDAVSASVRLPIAILDLARAEYVRGQVEMRERAAKVCKAEELRAERLMHRMSHDAKGWACHRAGAGLCFDAIRALEPEGGE